MKQLEIGVSVALAFLFLLVILSTAHLSYWSEATPGARFFPLWISLLGILLAGFVAWLAWKNPKQRSIDWPDREGAIRIGLIYLSVWFVVLSAPYLGFLTSATIFCLVFLLGLMRARVVPSIITTVVVIAIVRVLFVGVLDVQLPTGPFGF